MQVNTHHVCVQSVKTNFEEVSCDTLFHNAFLISNFRALEFMQVFLAEVARGEKDLAVAAGNHAC